MAGAIALVVCYFWGAIPFGLILGKVLKGVDIRDYGSGNIGTTNVLRTLGKGAAVAVFFFDTAKGLVPVLLCKYLLKLDPEPYWVVAGCLLAVCGHNFSVFIGFKGGKGVATSLGVIIGLDPVIAAIAFTGWGLLVLTTRYISVASLIAAVSVPLQMIFWRSREVPLPYQILAVVAALAIVVKHGSNMKRLLSGTEPKVGQTVSIERNEDEPAERDQPIR